MKYLLGLLLLLNTCFAQELKVLTDKEITVGAKRIDKFLPLLQNKNVAVVANITSKVANKHTFGSNQR